MENAPHTHTFKQTVIPSTCKERGYTLHKCECGYEHKENFQPIAPHSYETIEETKPDCINGGSKQMHCTVCGETISPTFPPLGHDWGHWNINEFATCTEEGKQTRFCGRCGESETQAIKPTGHKLSKPVKSQTQKGCVERYCENCGETFTKKPKAKKIIITVAILVAVTVAAVFATLKFFIPYYHYASVERLIEKGNYAQAYHHAVKCVGYKDTAKLINNFRFEEKKVITKTNEAISGMSDSWIFQLLFSDRQTTDISEYDEHGNPISVVTTSDVYDTSLTYKNDYDKNGNLICSSSYDEEGTPKGKTVYEYDNNGNLTKTTEYNAENKETESAEYEYDKNGNVSRIIGNYLSGLVSGTVKYNYDKNGTKLSAAVTCSFMGAEIDFSITYTYEYFDNGMKVNMEFLYGGGFPIFTQETTYNNPISYVTK